MQDRDPTTLGDIVMRMFWMMVGPMLLAAFGYLIIKTGNGWLTGPDFAFLGVLAGMMLARCLEFRRGNAQTAEGQPATSETLRRYLIGAVAIGLIAWVIANILGNYVLNLTS